MGEKFSGDKRGYLREPFRLFHLRDQATPQLDYHYHEFSKLVFPLQGRASYHLEGTRYFLKPLDVLLVGHGLIHRPQVDLAEPYERIILWLDQAWLEEQSPPGCSLDRCFQLAEERSVRLFRPQGEDRSLLRDLFQQLEEAAGDQAFGGVFLQRAALFRLLVALARRMETAAPLEEAAAYRFDPKMEEVTRFVAEHLGEDLSIDRLAGEFFLSRYYLMHRFKEVYGCTLHQYIRQRRLHRAEEDLRRGVPAMKASLDAGFRDYSAFLRAFRTAYGRSPRSWR